MSDANFDFVFFWKGRDIECPQALVRSIRMIYGDTTRIVQLSDRETPQVPGVSEFIGRSVHPDMMLSRLEACAKFRLSRPAVFLDADMLVIDRFDLPAMREKDVILLKREQNATALINPNFPEHYPEFEGKTLGEVMPFVACFIATANDRFFSDVLQVAVSLPERLHRWYGDQVALKRVAERKKYRIKEVPELAFSHPTKSTLQRAEIASARKSGVRILHFKGPKAKPFQSQTCDALIAVVGSDAVVASPGTPS
jgi:hypothetical protein